MRKVFSKIALLILMVSITIMNVKGFSSSEKEAIAMRIDTQNNMALSKAPQKKVLLAGAAVFLFTILLVNEQQMENGVGGIRPANFDKTQLENIDMQKLN